MRIPGILAIAALWAASVFAAAGVARLAAEGGGVPKRPPAGSTVAEALEARRGALAGRLARAQSERNRLFSALQERRDNAASPLETEAPQAAAPESPRLSAAINGVPGPEAQAVLERNARFLASFEDLREAPFDGIVHALGFLYDAGRLGGPAIDQLADYVEANPEAMNNDMGGMAVAMGLAAFPHERSLALLTKQLDQGTGLTEDLLGIWAYRQLSGLPAETVRPYAETFRQRAREQAETGRLREESVLSVAALAFAHGDAEARAILDEVIVNERYAHGAVAVAGLLHSAGARDWLEGVSRDHPSEEIRALADGALADWRAGL